MDELAAGRKMDSILRSGYSLTADCRPTTVGEQNAKRDLTRRDHFEMEAPRGNSWVDAETRAALQRVPPQKLAPATTDTYSLVVLFCDTYCEHARRVRAFDRVLCTSSIDSEFQTTRKPPFIVRRELTPTGALLAQFELICCDVVSVFVSDAVMSSAEPSYLRELYCALARSDEFEEVGVRLVSVPSHSAGRAWLDQFVGRDIPGFPYDMAATRKKARIMAHWAMKIGGRVKTRPI